MSKPRSQKAVTQDLCDLADRLTEVAITECDVTQWPGHGKSITEMDKQTRGDRYWAKQNATATILLVKNLHNLVSQRQAGQKDRLAANPTAASDDDILQQQVSQAERDSAEQIRKAMAKMAKH
ncbi:MULTISPECIES: hypothetical protein [Pantoea]|uniref:Uncharacterized protein n=1 Tax=Pantoea ananas TaxID=553 RepID=A0AAJ1CXF2_PANAN|nr:MULTISPECIES: hypothetical protein [Pantoea]ERM13479.1 hypothetical protein L585_13445 [Pantoea ananatis BRT175]MCW0310539.1 hypothetical protein [Pantoea ananatis]MCW0343434.1 hypothetical protein [Pantoea ananatis]REF09765.1 hypothetical protein C7428_2059 [Pantoea ananatis]UYK97809.1 hypothetical protein NG832_01880 [Pantoea stewartii]